MFNILQLTVAYWNATINVKPETQNRRLEPTGLAKPGETRGLTGTGPGLARQESAGRVFGQFWNWTDPFLWSKPGPLAGYPDPLLTLFTPQAFKALLQYIHGQLLHNTASAGNAASDGDRSMWHMQAAVPRISQRAKSWEKCQIALWFLKCSC